MIGTDKVFIPGPNRIFVFGSNLAGIHGAGAANVAFELYGAKWGQGVGLQGNSYALPTKDQYLDTLPLRDIEKQVQQFRHFAWSRQDLYFFVTRVGCGLAGYRDEEIGPLFAGAPNNCELPHGWR